VDLESLLKIWYAKENKKLYTFSIHKQILDRSEENVTVIFVLYLRIAYTIIDPSVWTNPFIRWHSIISTGLDMDQEQHIDHGFYDSI
jgi:hypothetical protein